MKLCTIAKRTIVAKTFFALEKKKFQLGRMCLLKNLKIAAVAN